MSISSSTRKAGPYSCNGATVAFPFSFKVFTTADVRVVLTDANTVESDLALGTNYTVALNADQDANPGGTVTTTAAYATGYKITLTSQVQNLQSVTLTNQGAFYPKVINDALDRLTILVQQVAEQVGRAVKTSISSSTSPDSLISTLLTAVSNALTYSNNASSSASSASASATAAAASAAALPNATGNANTVPVVNGTGNGWLMKTAAQMLAFLGLGVANQASGVVVLDAGSKLPAVDGSQLSGLPASLRNKLINGNFDIWQRGTSFAIGSVGFIVDRWKIDWNSFNGTGTVSQVAFATGQTAVPDEPTYYINIAVSAAASGQTAFQFTQRIEDVRTLAGKTVTISFYAVTSADKTVGIVLQQNFGSGGSAAVDTTVSSGFTVAAAGWAKYTFTVTLPSISGKTIGTSSYLALIFNLPLNQTFGINFAAVQVEEGGVATKFEKRPIGLELSLCQRYYEVLQAQIDTAQNGASYAYATWFYKATKRTTPTVVHGAGSTAGAVANYNGTDGYQCTVSSAALRLAQGSTSSAEL